MPATPSLIPVSLIGTGNLAWHLAQALTDHGFKLSQVYGRDLAKAGEICQVAGSGVPVSSLDFSQDPAKVFLLVVSDQAIAGIVSTAVFPPNAIIAHTSGSQSIEVLKATNRQIGVLYPLQSFSKNVPLNMREVPFLIEAHEDEAEGMLRQLAEAISDKVLTASSEERLQVHLAAVFAGNFTNHLIGISNSLLKEAVSDESLLAPLIRQTIEKALTNNPFSVQTGPAVRHDQLTLDKHLALLEKYAEWKEIYQNISRSIQKSKQDASAQ